MAGEQSSSASNPFLEHYPLPMDQALFETELHARFTAQFPDSADLMDKALAIVRGDRSFDLIRALDETPILGEPPGGKSRAVFSESLLTIKNPWRFTREEYGKLDPAQKATAAIEREGTSVVGSRPPETQALVEGLFALTGSSVVGQHASADGSRRTVIRAGQYRGQALAFIEDYGTLSQNGGEVFSLRIAHPETAQSIMDDEAIRTLERDLGFPPKQS